MRGTRTRAEIIGRCEIFLERLPIFVADELRLSSNEFSWSEDALKTILTVKDRRG